MKTFLEYVAEDILHKFGADLSRIAVVFPNKRAALFLNEHIARMAGKPVWSPAYITISELFRSHSSLTVGDSVKLVCDIHKSFTEATGIEESLDHFYGWGQLLLADFDDVDKNMADAGKVFANLRDIHELDDISYLTDEQKEMLRKFFSNFSEDQDSALKERFIKLWSRFGDIYSNYKSRLRKQNIAYEGMLYRDVATDETAVFEYDAYLFVGFNVVQKVEQTIFSRLKSQGKARFYWDFDQYYMRKNQADCHAVNEAGHYILQHMEQFPNELDSENEAIYDNFRHGGKKKITFMSASTENIQARYIATWLREKGRYEAGRRTAIVLCDESLLPSVIHCIPPEVGKVNITTGFPLSNSPISSYVSQLIALQTNGWSASSKRFRFKLVNAVLSHPYSQYLSSEYANLLSKLREEGRFFIRKERLCIDEGLSLLFTPTGDNLSLLQWLLDVLRLVASNSGDKDPLFTESLFRMYTLVNRISGLVRDGDLRVDVMTLQKLLTQIIGGTSIPFHGEPAEGVQIMGVLETRNLDFDHVLLLSCNEGNMPKGVNDSSFIPYSIRKAYGLTTVDNKVAIYAYYFNRLLQRAHDVSIAYNDSTEDGHTGEMSRFMLQLMVESGLKINRISLQAGRSRLFNEPRPIAKDSRVLEQMSRISYLSPTAINRYMRCQLQFYYNNVAGIVEPEEVSEDSIDNRVFGNIFHTAVEKLYKQMINGGRVITAEAISLRLKDRSSIGRAVDEAIREVVFKLSGGTKERPLYNGLQIINREVIIRYIVRLLEIDKTLAPFTLLMLEGKALANLKFTVKGELKTVQIGGRIDRMDKVVDKETHVEHIRVVDYKTGGALFKSQIGSVDDIFKTPPEPQKHADYYLQTMLYSMIIRQSGELNPQNLPVSPALLFIQHTKEDDYDPVIKIGKQKIADIRDYADVFRERLSCVAGEIFDPAEPFRPTTDSGVCALCPYSSICGI